MNNGEKTSRLNDIVLMVEDNERDYKQAVRSFRKTGCINKIFWCEDGDDALDYLYRKGKYSAPIDSPRPGLILMDINMPGTDGLEVLTILKKDEDLKAIPVCMLTTSTDERDIQRCYDSGASSYMSKPIDMNEFMKGIERLSNFWFKICMVDNEDDKDK